MLPTDFFDIYLFQLREPQILKRSMWVQYARSKMLNFLGGGVSFYILNFSVQYGPFKSIPIGQLGKGYISITELENILALFAFCLFHQKPTAKQG